MNENIFEGFIIYSTYRVEESTPYIYLYGRLRDGRSFCTKNRTEPFFYIRKKDLSNTIKIDSGLNNHILRHEPVSLLNFEREPVEKIITRVPKDVAELRKILETQGIECYEADVRFTSRFMMEKDIKGAIKIKGRLSKNNKENADCFFNEAEISSSEWRPTAKDFRILSIDIETSQDAKKLYCVSLYSNDEKLKKVLILSNKKLKHSESYHDEKSLLDAFKTEILSYDPDIITGWNLIDFDLKVIEEKLKEHNIDFKLGRTNEKCALKITDSFITDSKADFPGRMVLDGIHILKTSFIKLDDYKLGTAAKEFANEKKLIEDENKGETIDTYFLKEPQKLIDYNLLDAKLALEIIINS